jgi:hypothetical protein
VGFLLFEALFSFNSVPLGLGYGLVSCKSQELNPPGIGSPSTVNIYWATGHLNEFLAFKIGSAVSGGCYGASPQHGFYL